MALKIYSMIRTTKDNASISVVIPVHNARNYVFEAVKSVFDQTIKPQEIIIVDDGSTDDFTEELKIYIDDFKLLRQTNQGPPAARNHGLSKSAGEFIAFLDADDIWHTDKLERQLSIFENNRNVDVVVGLHKKFTDAIDPKAHYPPYEFQPLLGCSLIRSETFDKIGRLDEELFIGDDTDWFYRVREAGLNIFIHDDLVQFYRIHDQGITARDEKKNYYTFKVLHKAMARRKKNPLPPSNLNNQSEIIDLKAMWHTAT